MVQVNPTPTSDETRHAGHEMHDLARRLFPICRSLTGNGVRETLGILKERLPDLRLHEVASGTKCFDWTVPDEWNISSGRLTGPDGVVCDFSETNLRVVGYSEPVDRTLSLAELQPHLHAHPTNPDWIPYVTSYYRRDWGFCLTQRERDRLRTGEYHAKIDATLEPGSLTYADMIIPGETQEEVLLSTYMCHPSLANNELSGPIVTSWLAQHIASLPRRRYTYRIAFVPETIGSILYISRHLDHLKARVKAGFVVTCVGDDRAYSYMPSRLGGTLADRAALHVLGHHAPNYVPYSFLKRGSDERQYCSPGVDLPMCSVMRTRYGDYPEYHSSADDLTLVTPDGLLGGFTALRKCIDAVEAEATYRATTLCEPQMGKRGLYSTLSTGAIAALPRLRMDVLAYCDGAHSLIDIATLLNRPVADVKHVADELLAHDLIAQV